VRVLGADRLLGALWAGGVILGQVLKLEEQRADGGVGASSELLREAHTCKQERLIVPYVSEPCASGRGASPITTIVVNISTLDHFPGYSPTSVQLSHG
jgi:hypothetical protein